MILTHEEHSGSVAGWERLRYQDASVVCFDRHLDLKPLVPAGCDAVRSRAARSQPVGDLGRPSPFRFDEGAYGLDDFWAVGPLTGRVRSVTWVGPWFSDSTTTDDARRMLDAISLIPSGRAALEAASFSPGRLRVELCGLDLTVCGVAGLLSASLDGDERVDIDLDWQYDPRLGAVVSPADLANLLVSVGLAAHVDQMTYSITSGFMPESMRTSGPALASLLDADTSEARPARPARVVDPRISAMLAREQPLAIDELEELLVPIGSPNATDGSDATIRLCYIAQLAVAGGHAQFAAGVRDQLVEHGADTCWLDYRMGLAALAASSLDEAVSWLTSAMGDLLDTQQTHAGILAAVVQARRGDLEQSQALLRRLVGKLPFRTSLAELAVSVGDRMGDDELAASGRDHLRLQAQLLETAA